MLNKKVKEIMTTDVITTTSNVDVVNAFEELMEHKISAMPVVDDGKLVGIITATDLGHNLILDKYELGTAAKSIMIKDVVTVSPENTIQEAIEIMQSHAPDSNILNQLPVVENGKLVEIDTNNFSDGENQHHMGIICYDEIYSTADSLGVKNKENAFINHIPRFESREGFDFICINYINHDDITAPFNNIYIYFREIIFFK